MAHLILVTLASYVLLSVCGLSSSSSCHICDYQAKVGDLRLVNGTTPHNGRVEVYYNGTWGTVCGDSFGIDDAHVICRTLGYPKGAYSYHENAHFGQGTGSIWLDKLQCTSHSTNIQSCQAEWGSYGCTHQDDIGVTCLTDSTLRLRPSGASNRGRPEVYYDGLWGSICANNFNITDANLICDALGYPGAAMAYGQSFFGPGRGPIWLDNMDCSLASNLASCRSNGWGKHNCTHGNDAGLICATDGAVRLIGSTSHIKDGALYRGRVEVFYDNQWGTICKYGFDSVDANLVCRLLGYRKSYTYYVHAGGSGPVWREYLKCTPTSSDLFECGENSWGKSSCPHSYDIGVECTNSASTCTKTLGERWETWMTWSDKEIAQAPITGLRVWRGEYVNNIQVRYGDIWAPRRPEYTVGAMTEYLFNDNERLMRVQSGQGWVINQLIPQTNQRIYGTVEEGNGVSYNVGGDQILYFSGSVSNDFEPSIVSGLNVHISECSTVKSGSTAMSETEYTRKKTSKSIDDSTISSDSTIEDKDASTSITDVTETIIKDGVVRLVDGTGPDNGRVEVYYKNQWGTICDDEFSMEDADFICLFIGFSGAKAAHGNAYFGEGSGPILGDKLACDVNSTNILSCMQQGWGQHNCTHKQDAGVTCLLDAVPTGPVLIADDPIPNES